MRKGKIGKRFLSIILACAMLTSMVPFAAFADETETTNTVVSSFDDLKSAVANAKDGDTITLDANIEIPAGPENNLIIDDAITINGANHSITRAFDNGKGSDGYGNYEEVFYIQSEGVTIENVTINGLDQCMKDEAGIYIAANGTETQPIIIQNCVFNGADSVDAESGGTGIISQGGSAAYVNVLNCQFSNLKYGMYFNAISNAEISDNVIDGTKYTGIWMAGSDVTVENNTLTNIATTEYNDPQYNSGIYVNGTESKNNSIANNSVSLSDNATGTAIASTNVARIGDSYYDSLDAAISAAEDGAIIELLCDVVVDGANVQNNNGIVTFTNHGNDGAKNITLDGQGYTLTASGVTNNTPSMINVEYGANVTIKNLTIDGYVDANSSTKHGVNVYNATATLENVTIRNGSGYGVVANGSIVTVNGLTTENNNWGGINVDNTSGIASLRVNDATINEENSVKIEQSDEEKDVPTTTINGGTFQNIFSTVDLTQDNLVIRGGRFATNGAEGAVNVVDYVPEGYYYNPSTGTVAERPTSPGTSNYPVTIKSSTNGMVSVAKADEYANPGETIVVTVTPDAGYKLDKLTVSGGVDVTDNEDGTYSFTMPASAVTITATFVEDPDYVEPTPEPEPTPDPTPSMPFTDVNEGDWFYDVVQYAYDNGLMTGTSATTFEPNTSTTRGMIVAVLNRLEGGPTAEAAGFTDVNNGDWYADAVNWAASVGIVNGFEDNTFRANDPITREQMAAILYNYADYKGYDVSKRADLSGYADADSISSWALDTLEWANAEGLITGMSADTIAPQGQATRAQVAAMFQRFLTAEK